MLPLGPQPGVKATEAKPASEGWGPLRHTGRTGPHCDLQGSGCREGPHSHLPPAPADPSCEHRVNRPRAWPAQASASTSHRPRRAPGPPRSNPAVPFPGSCPLGLRAVPRSRSLSGTRERIHSLVFKREGLTVHKAIPLSASLTQSSLSDVRLVNEAQRKGRRLRACLRDCPVMTLPSFQHVTLFFFSIPKVRRAEVERLRDGLTQVPRHPGP